VDRDRRAGWSRTFFFSFLGRGQIVVVVVCGVGFSLFWDYWLRQGAEDLDGGEDAERMPVDGGCERMIFLLT